MATRKRMHPEDEGLYARHVYIHTHSALQDARKAMEATPAHLTLHRLLREAVVSLQEADKVAERWRYHRTAEQLPLEPPPAEAEP